MFLCDLLLLKALRSIARFVGGYTPAGTRWRVPAGGRDAVSSIGVGMLWFNFKLQGRSSNFTDAAPVLVFPMWPPS